MQSANETINRAEIQQLFQKSADVKFQTYTFENEKVLFMTCDAMVDEQLLNDVVVKRVQMLFQEPIKESFEKVITRRLHIPGLQKVEKKEELISLVYGGHVVLYFDSFGVVYASNIAKKPNRNPEETRLEVSVKGPQDNFIEDISVNIALIRKRLPTNSLCVEKYKLGTRSKTEVALLYFDDIVDKQVLKGIKRQLEKVDVDIVFSGDVLMESVNKNTKLFPKALDTGRPDFAVQTLIRGRFLILIDGVAYGMLLPVNLFVFLKTGEDNEYPTVFASFGRLVRLTGLFVGLLLPAFWLALTTYHQNQLPLQLLSTVIAGNTGLPFPAALEMLLMVLMFELFREAGLRLPAAVGGTISVVGGLIIGDAAIRAGITSPTMIVVIALSTIATFTLVNQSLVNAVGILRIFFIVASAFLGLFGFFMSIFFTVLYVANIRVFGVPYLNLTADLNWKTIGKSLLRLSARLYKKRPIMLNPTDATRKGDDGDE